MLLTIFIVFIGGFLLERLLPGWRLPHVRTWPVRVVAVNLIQLGVVLLAGIAWERWLSAGSLFNLGVRLKPWPGGLLASSLRPSSSIGGIALGMNPMCCGASFIRFITARNASR